jgi:enoyl-CoA hydratase/carnithine racemase
LALILSIAIAKEGLMDFRYILLDKKDHIATITLNRPEKLNALNEQMFDEIAKALVTVAGDDEIRVLILKGAGPTFCAGADLREEEGEEALRMQNAEEIRRDIRRSSRGCIEGLQQLPQPTIAVIQGACVGAGFDLALACDMRIGAGDARFMVAYTRVGMIPGQGGAWLLARIAGLPKAAEMLFTGDFMNAQDALKYNVLNKMVSIEDLEDETLKMARRIAAIPPIANRINKMHLYRMLHMDLATALDFAAASQPILITSEDTREAINAFLEKRQGIYKGR